MPGVQLEFKPHKTPDTPDTKNTNSHFISINHIAAWKKLPSFSERRLSLGRSTSAPNVGEPETVTPSVTKPTIATTSTTSNKTSLAWRNTRGVLSTGSSHGGIQGGAFLGFGGSTSRPEGKAMGAGGSSRRVSAKENVKEV